MSNLIDSPSHGAVRAMLRERLLARMTAADEPEAAIVAATPAKGFTQRTVDYPNCR